MKIKLAEHYGMCFGVRDAIAEAERLAGEGPLTILGELVHNPVVGERLRMLGVEDGVFEVGAARTERVMITAHGASDRKREEWRLAGFGVADGTCPLVRQAHGQLGRLVGLGYFPVVIGKRGHAEVVGLTGDFPEAYVIEVEEDILGLPWVERYGVISQTTQTVERVKELVEAIRVGRPGREVEYRDTVCQPTKNRQRALGELVGECEALVVVGGRNSNNTGQLARVAREAGRVVFQIERPEELEAGWFVGVKSVGVTGGTSTLKESIHAVYERLKGIAVEMEEKVAMNEIF